MPSQIKVPLSRPIEPIPGTVLAQLTLREPTGADLRGAPDPTEDRIGWALVVAGRIANAPAGTVDSLNGRDAFRVATAVFDFFGDPAPSGSGAATLSVPAGLETGATSSASP